MNRNGALLGIVVGTLRVVIWKQISAGIFDLYEIVLGLILATISVIAVSLLSAKPSEKVLNKFEKCEKKSCQV